MGGADGRISSVAHTKDRETSSHTRSQRGGNTGKLRLDLIPLPPSCARTGRLPRLTDGAERGGGGGTFFVLRFNFSVLMRIMTLMMMTSWTMH